MLRFFLRIFSLSTCQMQNSPAVSPKSGKKLSWLHDGLLRMIWKIYRFSFTRMRSTYFFTQTYFFHVM